MVRTRYGWRGTAGWARFAFTQTQASGGRHDAARLALLAISRWLQERRSPRTRLVAVARATIESVAPDGASLAVRTRAGEDRTVRLNPKTIFVLVVPASLADVKPGAFIGVAAMPGEGGER